MPSINVLRILLLSLFIFTGSIACASDSDFDSGMRFLQEKDYEKALHSFDRSVDADPTNSEFHIRRGQCLSVLGKDKEACAEFKLAALLTSDNKLKEECRKQLARYNLELPRGSVNDDLSSRGNKDKAPTDSGAESSETNKGEKMFHLSSKKLDWNLQLSGRFLQSVKTRTDNLNSMARGNRWRVPSDAWLNGALDMRNALRGGPAHFSVALSNEEKKVLTQCDVAVILDHSASMSIADCPTALGGAESRISWCAEEIDNFAGDLAAAFPHGFHFITFDTKPDVYSIRSAAQLREILLSVSAGGGTDLSTALKEAFRLHTAHPQQPLLVAVITDAEIDVHSCEKTIINATRQFPLPNGVFISLLQVGVIAEIHTADNIGYLDNLRTTSGAAYDSFVAIPFSRVRREGLGRDLLAGLITNVFAKAAPPENKTSPDSSAHSSAATGAKKSGSVRKTETSTMPQMWPAHSK